jgi:cytochrome P450
MPTTMSHAADALCFNPFRERLLIDPYPRFAEVRSIAPVYWSDELALFFLTGYDAVRRAVTDVEHFSNRTPHLRVKPDTEPGEHLSAELNWFMNSDPPDHTPLRRFFGTAFTPRRVQALRDDVEAIAAKLLDDAPADGDEFDFVRALAYPLPTMVISAFIGAPVSDIELIKSWSSAFSAVQELDRTPELVQRANDAIAEARKYLHRLLELRKEDPKEDLISYALQARDDDSVSDRVLVDNCILMLSAGHETTINFLGNALLGLLRDQPAFSRLRREPEILPAAVEELLRYDTPVQVTSRVLLKDTELEGVAMNEGQRVVVLLGAANRDPSRFDEPDELNFDRQPNAHLAFAHGAHHCLGAPIARLESEIVFRAMAERFAHVELTADPVPAGTVMTRGWREIRVRTR